MNRYSDVVHIIDADSEETIQSVIDRMKPGEILQLKRGRYHQTIDVSGKQRIRIEAFPGDEGEVLMDGLMPVRDWNWKPGADALHWEADYPGFPDLLYWQGNHPEGGHNYDLMYPLLAVVEDTPLLWQSMGETALQPGSFYVDSDPREPGRMYVRLDEGQSIEALQVSPFARLLWGDDTCEGISVRNIHFKGCSNTGKTGAVNTPGVSWYMENVVVSLVNTIGIELGQGGDYMEMRGNTMHSTFVHVRAERCGQMGWWGAAAFSTLENCGHSGSNWKGFDHWWEASHKFENCTNCLFIRWHAEDCRGPGFWFDLGNTDNILTSPVISNCVRTGIELELGASNNKIYDVSIRNIRSETIHPEKDWDVAVGILVKADSNGNVVNGGIISGCKTGIQVKNDDSRGDSANNTFRNLTLEDNRRDFRLDGERLNNQWIKES